ncbi:MAG: 1-deoxy-D-xylulose-5-phosphate reductoisomerase [Synergistaceae bacterium]
MNKFLQQRVAVIGATGSVGTSVLDICRKFPNKFKVVALAAHKDHKKLIELASEFKVKKLCLTSQNLNKSFLDKNILIGEESLNTFAFDDEIDHIIFASSGINAIKTLQFALTSGKNVSLANKESIVVGGKWVMPLVKYSGQLRPIDSEHSAIWQCLRDDSNNDISKIWLTASGGPFLNYSIEEMKTITPAKALDHPVWKMGSKITIDSATLMNKGIECLEAMQLFNLHPKKVDALIHPNSLVHGMVLYKDTTIKMLFSKPDMKLPVAAALAYPERLDLINQNFDIEKLEMHSLEFKEIDKIKFPCFKIALDVADIAGAYIPLMVGADEVAVDCFIKGKISFTDIPNVIDRTLSIWNGSSPKSLDDAIELVSEGQRICIDLCNKWR